MAVNLSKEQAIENFVNLKKKADQVVQANGLGNQTARVALAIDISISMDNLFNNNTVQNVVERLLALGVKFDDNKAIDIFLFGKNDYEVGELHESDFYKYVDNMILRKYNLEGSTNYAGVMQRIVDKYSEQKKSVASKRGSVFSRLFGKKEEESNGSQILDPAYVMVVTDGDNQDKAQAEKVIRESSNLPIFWQFVGVGNSTFSFLKQLDSMEGRVVDNANFFQLNDFRSISDEELFNRLLAEFPTWIQEAKIKGILKDA